MRQCDMLDQTRQVVVGGLKMQVLGLLGHLIHY